MRHLQDTLLQRSPNRFVIYQSPSKHRSWFSIVGTIGIVVLLFIAFVVAVAWFRASKPKESPLVESISDVLTKEQVSEKLIEQAIDTDSVIASLALVSDGSVLGKAVRSEFGRPYELNMTAVLPEIDRSVSFYQVWLLRPIPYEFFPLGEMITNELGEFAFEWEWDEQPIEKRPVVDDEKELWKFTTIIITQQEYGGSLDPGPRIVEAEFGE